MTCYDKEIKRKAVICHCMTIFIFLFLFARVLTSKEVLHLCWTKLHSVACFFLMLPSFIGSQRAFGKYFKKCIMLLFSCCTFPLVPPLSLHHIHCFCICRKNNSDGRGGLPADLLIIHHSHVVFIVRSGWVSSSNLYIPSIRVRLHYDSEDDWEGICSLQESGQLHCFCHAVRHSASPKLPAPSDPAWCGWNSNEHSIWALSLEYALKCH